MKRLLFLCTGNYYRSRFAEIFFNWHAEQRGLHWRAESRGLRLEPANLGPLSEHTLSRLALHGIDVAAYQRLPLDAAADDFEAADYIIAVKATEHRPLMERRFPEWVSRVEFWEVHDVDCATPAEAIPHLEQHLFTLLERLS